MDDEVFMGFFPPTDEYYTDLLQDKTFENFLMSDGTTKEGQDRIADFYGPEGRSLYCLNLNCRAPPGRLLQPDLTGWWRDV